MDHAGLGEIHSYPGARRAPLERLPSAATGSLSASGLELTAGVISQKLARVETVLLAPRVRQRWSLMGLEWEVGMGSWAGANGHLACAGPRPTQGLVRSDGLGASLRLPVRITPDFAARTGVNEPAIGGELMLAAASEARGRPERLHMPGHLSPGRATPFPTPPFSGQAARWIAPIPTALSRNRGSACPESKAEEGHKKVTPQSVNRRVSAAHCSDFSAAFIKSSAFF
jgi:hypothetical protein